MKKIILAIEGMTCSACSNGLEKYLNKQKGIEKATVNLVMANALVEYDEKIVNQEKIEEYIKQAGFKSLGEFKEIKIEDKNKKERIKFIKSSNAYKNTNKIYNIHNTSNNLNVYINGTHAKITNNRNNKSCNTWNKLCNYNANNNISIFNIWKRHIKKWI